MLANERNQKLILCFLADIFAASRPSSKKFVVLEHQRPKTSISFCVRQVSEAKPVIVPEIKIKKIKKQEKPSDDEETVKKVDTLPAAPLKMPYSARLAARNYKKPAERKEIQLKRIRFSPR